MSNERKTWGVQQDRPQKIGVGTWVVVVLMGLAIIRFVYDPLKAMLYHEQPPVVHLPEVPVREPGSVP